MNKTWNLCVAVLIVTGLAMSSCSEGPKRFRRLVVYSPHGLEILQDLARLFEAQHQHEEVGIRAASYNIPSHSILRQIEEERVQPRCDVWWGGSALMFMEAKAGGLLDPCPAAEVATHLSLDLRDPDYYWLGTFVLPAVIVYNKAAIPDWEAPRDWDDLLNPKWKGRILIQDPVTTDVMAQIFCALIQTRSGGTGNPEAGYEWLRNLESNVLTHTANTEHLFAELNEGKQAALTIWTLSDVVVQRHRYNYNLGYVIPESGTPVLTEGVALIRGSSHLETGKLFVEFVTSADMQLYMADPKNGYYRIPTRNDLGDRLPEWLKGVDVRDMLRKMPIDWSIVRRDRAEWIKYWDEQIRNKNLPEDKSVG
ncbi:MAG TPA: extracellular solute-binding protein [bacterium]|nr:extracellular solute-binding protein [bacterium]